MKANELRVGNLFTMVFTVCVNGIEPDGRIHIENNILKTCVNIDKLKPIPLTEEVLVECGFERIRQDSKYFKLTYAEKGTYLLFGLGNWHTEICLHSSTTAQGETKHLHQLQNLYFALTGEELEIKL